MKIGIALGGGGSKAFAHLGVLKALEESGIMPDVISGASAGSIVGAFIGQGRKPEDILELVKNNKFLDYAAVALPVSGLFTLNNLEENLKKHLFAHTFSDLKIPLYVAVSNLYSGKIEYLSEGPLIPVIKASCSIPVLFSPVEINKMLYVDGGVLDNLPYMPLKGKCDKIIAVNVTADDNVSKISSIKEVATRVFELIANKDRTAALNDCDLLIEPAGLEAYKILDTRYAGELFELGYNYCKNNVNLESIIG